MSHASSSTSRSGCGCGGSSGGAMRPGNVTGSSGKGGGCSCGGGGAVCQGQDFARPRFFAGQLLTEDDLDLLGSYVVEKNRLHNRSFFGEGVVCGLMVTCDPCGGGQVIVQSGYALDCCGNDVVVPCPQPVDVNALVKRLRIEKTGGVDCGDPCSDERAKKATVDSSSSTGSTDTEAPPLPRSEYCLYVRYCEQATDPVSPYATDDPCGAQACEATRIREGFTFELRCRACEEHEPDNLFSRIRECLGNLITAEKTTRSARSTLLYSAGLGRALYLLDAQKPAALVSAERLDEAKQAQDRIATLPARAEDWTAVHAFDAADSARTLASLLAAWHTMPAADRDALENKGAVEGMVKQAQGSLSQLQRVTPKDRLASLIEDPLDRDVVVTTTDRALLWSKPAEAMKTLPAGELEMISVGVVYDRKIRSSLAATMARIKANLIDRLQSRGPFTDCRLLEDVQAIVIPDDAPQSTADRSGAATSAKAAERLIDALLRFLRQCICDAINPPCPPCDDPAVLLACLRVEGCEVVDICNLERTFVLTPVTMRYWMPFLRSIGNLLERLCCPANRCDPPSKRTSSSVAQASFEPLPRAYVERRSALESATRWVGPARPLDPARIAAALPSQLSFSPENARLLAYSTASVLDVVSLRHGVPVGDLLATVFAGPVEVPAAGGQPAAPPAAFHPPVPPETLLEVGAMRTDLDDLKKRLTAADERNRKLEVRVKKLGG